jgi:hypothetical protein
VALLALIELATRRARALAAAHADPDAAGEPRLAEDAGRSD